MNRIKSKLEDEKMLVDETADPVERSSAAAKLLSDGYGKMVVPVLEQWFDSKEFILRQDAVSLLLASLGHEKHLDKGIRILRSDKNWTVRSDAARGIGKFCLDFVEGKKYEVQIIKELLFSLLNDEDEFVKQESYQWICNIIAKTEKSSNSDSFNLKTDADWNLLQPYLDKYGLQRPT